MRYVGVLALLLFAFDVRAGDISGVARVIDGDTIEVSSVRIRLWGIDAPELSDRGGGEAKAFLDGLLLGKTVRCKPRDKDRYGRIVAMCFFLGDIDVAKMLVLRRHARDWPKYSGGYYGRK